MVDAWLVVLIVVMSIVLLGVALLILVYYMHPDDKNQAWIPKIIVIIGLWLAFASVLVIPYDVANQHGTGGGVNVGLLWQIIYIAFAVMICAVIPFAFFYYENEIDPSEQTSFWNGQTGKAIVSTIVFAIILIVIMAILYSFMNEAELPIERIQITSGLITPYNSTFDPVYGYLPPSKAIVERVNRYIPCNGTDQSVYNGCYFDEFTWSLSLTFPLWIMAFLAFIGWFFFTCFVGVGFIALPLDLINDFRTRPLPMTTQDYMKTKIELGERAAKLLSFAEKLKNNLLNGGRTNRSKVADTRAYHGIQKHFFFLRKDVEILDVAYRLKGGNPLIPFAKLVLGIIGIVLSLMWYIHIAAYVLPNPPYHAMLNDMFVALDDAFSLLGVVFFAIFSFWLLACAAKGNFKLGVRVMIIKMYPMEPGKTYMNSFLANTWILMMCAVPAVQFCTQAFPIYARYTDITVIFGTQIRYVKYLSYFWAHNVFIIAMLAFSFLTVIVLIFWPNDASKKVDDELKRLVRAAAEDAPHR